MFNLSRRGLSLRGLKGGFFLLLATLALFASIRGREFVAPALTATLAAFRPAPLPAPSNREVGPGPQTLIYQPNMAYVYDLDLEMKATITLTTAESGTQPRDQNGRIKAKVRVIPGTPGNGSTQVLMQLDEPLDLLGVDEYGNMVSQSIRAEMRDELKHVFSVQQASDGTITGIQFQSTTSPGLTAEEVTSVHNTLRGVAQIFDFRLIQPNTSLNVVAEDAAGTYNAAFTRGATQVIERSKNGYVAYSPGAGLFDISNGGQAPVASTLSHTGHSTIVLGEGNIIQSNEMTEQLQLISSTTPPSGSEFDVNGSNLLQGHVQLLSQVSASFSSLRSGSWGATESLQAKNCCRPTTPDLSTVEELRRVLQGLSESPNPEGQGIFLAKAIREASDLTDVHAWISQSRHSIKARQEMAAALGMVGTPEAQNIMLGLLMDRSESGPVRAQILLDIQVLVNPEPSLLAPVESLVSQAEGNQGNLAMLTLGALAGNLGETQPETARRIAHLLSGRLLQAKEEMEKRTLVAALAGTKCEEAIPMIELALDDEQSSVRETAARALRAFSSPRAKQALARGERLHLFPTGPLNMVSGMATNPQGAIYQTCSALQNDLGLNGSINWKCEDKHIGFGTNFIGAGAQAIAGYGTVGTWGSDFKLAGKAQASVVVAILGVDLPIFDMWVKAGWSYQPSTSNRFFQAEYSWIGSTAVTFDWSKDGPGSNKYELGSRGKGYRWCGPIGPFWFCIEVGLQVNYGVERSFLGSSTMADNNAILAAKAIHYSMAPYGSVTAYVEGSISFVCVKLSVKLQGNFLIHKYPIRFVADLKDYLESTPNDPSKLNACLLLDEERQAWQLQLYGTFKYCIGSKTKLLWEAGGPVSTSRLATRCFHRGDVAVGDITWSPSDNPDMAAPLDFTVDITNLADYSTPAFTPVKGRLFIDGQPIGGVFQLVEGGGRISPRQTLHVGPIRWAQPSEGTHSINVKFDESNDLDDGNTANNTLATPKSVYILPSLPDIAIGEVQVTQLVPNSSPCGLGQDLKLRIKILNNGPGPWPMWAGVYLPATLVVHHTGHHVGMGLAQFAVAPTTQTTREFWVECIIPKCHVDGIPISVDRIDMEIDAGNGIREKFEDNNTMLNVDVQPPSVGVLTVEQSNGNISFKVPAQDNSNSVLVRFFVDGTQIGTGWPDILQTPSVYGLSVQSSSLSAGTHQVMARAEDPGGLFTSTSQVSFSVAAGGSDILPPQIQSISVGGKSGIVYMGASNVNDNVGVTRVEFFVDGSLVGLGGNSMFPTSYSLSFDSRSISDGNHILNARAYDAAGNVGQPNAPITFDIHNQDNVPPNVGQPSVTLYPNAWTFQVVATDDVQLGRVEFVLDGGQVINAADRDPYPGSTPYPGNVWKATGYTALAAGTHTLLARAVDHRNNVAESATISFTVGSSSDTTPPVVNSVSEGGTAGSISLSATASDNLAVTKLEFSVDAQLVNTQFTSSTTVWMDSTQLADGTHTLVVKAYDAAGNVGTSAPVSFSIANSAPDTQAPTVSASVSGTSGVITLSASATDNVGVARVEFLVDGVLKGTDNTLPYSLSMDSTALANGNHVLVAKAYDAAGNVGTSASVPFTISNAGGDTQPPVLSNLAVVRLNRRIWVNGGYEYITTFRISVSATDTVGVSKVEFYVDGGLVATDTSSPYLAILDETYSGAGPLEVKAIAYDAAGNVANIVITYAF